MKCCNEGCCKYLTQDGRLFKNVRIVYEDIIMCMKYKNKLLENFIRCTECSVYIRHLAYLPSALYSAKFCLCTRSVPNSCKNFVLSIVKDESPPPPSKKYVSILSYSYNINLIILF